MNVKTEKADVILTSNTVFTGVNDQPEPASIAIRNNKILAIGTEEDMSPFIDTRTTHYHYKDQLIMPGFHDFHTHIMQGCIYLDSVDLSNARSEEEAVEMVKSFAKAKPNDKWIIGFTWDAGYWETKQLPCRNTLDEILPDRPVILFHAEGHDTWVNSKALELAGINRDTENPEYGEIIRDKAGEPTGVLIEKATQLVTDIALKFSDTEKKILFNNFLRHAAKLGITSINDLYAPLYKQDELKDYKFFKGFEDNNELTLRIHLWPELNEDLDRARYLRDTFCSEMLCVSGLKQFIDGVTTARTAYLLDPYTDHPETRGEPTFDPDQIKKWVIDADKEGFSIRFHAIGDAAIRLALDSYEAAEKNNGVRDSRHNVEHAEVIHPEDIERFHQLGVTASMQPDHLGMSERNVYTARLGETRAKSFHRTNTLLQSGANLAFGTDFPIDVLNPMLQIYRAITRIDSTGKDTWSPEEKITLSEALKAYTSGSAYGTFTENELGTLEVGKKADIIVLDRNLFDKSPDEIIDATSVLTMVDGEIVYNNSDSL